MEGVRQKNMVEEAYKHDGKIVQITAVDLSGIMERLDKMEQLLLSLYDQQERIMEVVARTEALQRKALRVAMPSKYEAFKEWVESEVKGQYDYITSNEISAMFNVSKVTALTWMRRLAQENPKFIVFEPEGKQAYRIALRPEHLNHFKQKRRAI